MKTLLDVKAIIALLGGAFPLSWFSLEREGGPFEVVLHIQMGPDRTQSSESCCHHRIVVIPEMLRYSMSATGATLIWENAATGEGKQENDWRERDRVVLGSFSDAIGWVSLTRQELAAGWGLELYPAIPGRVRLPNLCELCWRYSCSYWAGVPPAPFRKLGLMGAKITPDMKSRVTYTVSLLRPGDFFRDGNFDSPSEAWAVLSQSGLTQEIIGGGRPHELLAVPGDVVLDIERIAAQHIFEGDKNAWGRARCVVHDAAAEYLKNHPETTGFVANTATWTTFLCDTHLGDRRPFRFDDSLPRDTLWSDSGDPVCAWEPLPGPIRTR